LRDFFFRTLTELLGIPVLDYKHKREETTEDHSRYIKQAKLIRALKQKGDVYIDTSISLLNRKVFVQENVKLLLTIISTLIFLLLMTNSYSSASSEADGTQLQVMTN